MAKGSKSRSTVNRTARRSYPASNRRLTVLQTYNLLRPPTLYELLSPSPPVFFEHRRSTRPEYVNRNLGRAQVHPVDAPDPQDMTRAIRHCQARGERREVLFALGRTGKGSARGPRRPKSEVKC